MRLLEELALSQKGLSLAKLSERLDAPKTSLFSLLRALETSGYVTIMGGNYRIGTATLRLGAIITGGNSFLRSIRTALINLSETSNETALIGILTEDKHEATYIDTAESQNAIRFSVRLGTRLPLYCTTLGRVLLAYHDDDFLETYFAETQLRAYTDKTLVRKDEILAHLREVRNSGVAETREEIVAGVMGFGAPIFDRNERIVAAVLIAAPVDRALARRAKLVELTRGAGSEMSQILGYTGLYPPPTHRPPDPRA